MAKHFKSKNLLAVLGAGTLIMFCIAVANADSSDRSHEHDRYHGNKLRLSDRPKEIVVDNLDTFELTKGDPQQAAVAQEVCGDCHSTDYPATQPKLSCASWGKEIVKMGNTMGAVVPWEEDGVDKAKLTEILKYLADNYGDSQGYAGCTGNELDPLPIN